MSTPYGSSLLLALAGTPALPNAKCCGKSALFDQAGSDEDKAAEAQRYEMALSLCNGCPSLEACGTWYLSLRPSDRPRGVIAGRINQPVAGRPKQVAS